jgi:hypothetical protein
MTVATQIQAEATIVSLANPIDTLAVLDRQVKDLTAKTKELKDGIANTYGLCEKDANGKIIAHRGEMYGVKVTIENRIGSVDVEAVIKALGITEDEFNAKFRGESSAIIKVSPCA